MKVEELSIPGLKLITPKSFEDSRGFFVERYNESLFKEKGLPTDWVQDNFSCSKPKVLRGLHYQFDKPQSKLVSCAYGAIFDVAVDIRKDSPTFGQSVTVKLQGDIPQFFLIPAGFAHGFCVLGDQPACVTYKVNSFYNSQGESGLLWNESEFKIEWPVENPILSEKDQALSSFSEYLKNPHFV